MTNIDPSKLDGLIINSRYEIDSLRHTGGFAHIYLANEPNLHNRRVAVKVLREQYSSDDSWRKYFIDEAQSLEKVKSPNVVVVYDLIRDDPDTGLHYLIMEWIEGENLDQFRRSRTTPKIELLLTLAIGIAEGIEGIHNNGLAHRDITPKNIMIKDGRTPIIIDFGLAWEIQFDIEVEKKDYGTISYLAPEQFAPNPLHSQEADIYALGAVLFFLFTGSHYFPELEEAEAQRGSSIKKHGSTFLSLFEQRKLRSIKSSELPGKLRLELITLVHSMLNMDGGYRPLASDIVLRLKLIQSTFINQQSFLHLKAKEYSIVTAVHNEGYIYDGRHEFTARKLQGQWVFEIDDLYLAPQQKNCTILVIQNESVVYSHRYYIEQQPFSLVAKLSSTGEITNIEISNGTLLHETSSTNHNFDFRVPVSNHKYIQLSLLIDGAMGESEINLVKQYIKSLFQKISTPDHEVNVSVCVYGEYKYHPGKRRNDIPFDIFFQDFTSSEAASRFIDKILKVYDFKDKGYAGSLELAMLYLKNKVKWTQEASKYMLLIGSSPPHPNISERAKFSLFDFTIEEYPDTSGQYLPHWKIILEQLRTVGVHSKAVWISPSDFDLSSLVREYVSSVWVEFDDEHKPVMSLQDDILEGNDYISTFIESTVKPIARIASTIEFPLLAPLDIDR